MVSARTTYARRFRAPNRTQSKLALSFPGEAPVKKLKVGQGAVFTALRGVTAWRFILEAYRRGQRLALFFRSPRAWGRGFFSVRPPASDGSTRRLGRGDMASDVRIGVTLACEECKRRNYETNKSRRNTPDRIEMRKFCRWCGRHTPHKETR